MGKDEKGKTRQELLSHIEKLERRIRRLGEKAGSAGSPAAHSPSPGDPWIFAEYSADMIARYTPEGVFIYASPASGAMLGTPVEELPGKSLYEFVHDDDRSAVRAIHDSILRDGEVVAARYRLKRSDGTSVWLESSARLVLDRRSGEASEIVGVSRDVTARVAMEELLRRRHEDLGSIFRAFPDLLFRLDGRGTIIDYRAGPVAELMMPPEHFIGRTVAEVLPSDASSPLMAAVKESLASGEMRSAEYSLTIDSTLQHYEARFIPVEDGGVIGLVRNITARREAELALRASEARTSAIVNNAVDAIITIDEAGVIDSFNPAAEMIFGYRAAEVIGKNVKMLMPPPYCEEHDDYLKNYLRTGERKIIGVGREIIGLRKNGQAFPVDLAVSEFTAGGKRCFAGMIRDISLRKRSEVILKESEERYRLIAENSTDMIARHGPDGTFLYVSPASHALLGFGPAELEGRSPYELFHPEDLERIKGSHLSVIRNPDISTVSYRMKRKDGGYVWLETTSKTVREPSSGGVVEIVTVSRDITMRRRAEEELRASEERLELFFNQSLDGFFFMMIDEPVDWRDIDGREAVLDYVFAHQRMTKVNDAMVRQYRAEREQFLGLRPADFFEHDLQSGRKVWRHMFDEGRLHIETEERKFDGTPMWIEGDYICLYDAEGRITGHFGIQREVTDRKLAEEALRRSEARFRKMFEHSPIGKELYDARGKIISMNPAACVLFGVRGPEDVKGYNLFDDLSLPHDARERLFNGDSVSVEISINADQKRNEGVFSRRNANRKDLELMITPMAAEEKGVPGNYLVHIHDVTEHREADRLKREFVSVVSHELRTPMTSIVGALGLMAGGAAGTLPDGAVELVEIARRNSERLLALINDILDMEKIESGRMSFSFAPVDMGKVVRQSVENNRQYAAKYDVRMEMAGDAMEAHVWADENRLFQVMANLLSNAVKFSPAGGVVLVRTEPRDSMVRVSVEDNGPGIPDDQRTKIFKKFMQLDSSDSRKAGGTGLGLSIVKAIVDRMGGSVDFESLPGVRTVFYVDLPLWKEGDVSMD